MVTYEADTRCNWSGYAGRFPNDSGCTNTTARVGRAPNRAVPSSVPMPNGRWKRLVPLFAAPGENVGSPAFESGRIGIRRREVLVCGRRSQRIGASNGANPSTSTEAQRTCAAQTLYGLRARADDGDQIAKGKLSPGAESRMGRFMGRG